MTVDGFGGAGGEVGQGGGAPALALEDGGGAADEGAAEAALEDDGLPGRHVGDLRGGQDGDLLPLPALDAGHLAQRLGVLGDDPAPPLPAQGGDGGELVGVLPAAVEDEGAGVALQGAGAGAAPALLELRQGLHGDVQGDAAAAEVGGPLVEREPDGDRGLVQQHRDRRVEAAAGHGRGEQPRLVGDLGDERGRERRHRAAGLVLPDHVQRLPADDELAGVEVDRRRGVRRRCGGRRRPTPTPARG